MQPVDPDMTARPVFVLSEAYEAFDGPWHTHRRAQFVYASSGVLTTRTATGLWVVPPHRAVWIPPNEPHKGSASRAFMLRTLYAEPGLAPVPPTCRVVSVDPLLDALLAEVATFGPDYPEDGPEQRLVQVVLDRLARLAVVPSHLPLPSDPRLLHLTSALEAHPADPRPLDALAADSGMTGRTAARLFAKETGLTFSQWRQQLRLLKALQRLCAGDSVTHAAAEVGYGDVSAFIAVFKEAFGETPARYIRAGRDKAG